MSGMLEQVIKAPQRGAAVPDGSGRFAIYQEALHSLSSHETNARVLLLDISTGVTSELYSGDGSNGFIWIQPTTNIIWQKQAEDRTELWTCNVNDTSQRHKIASFSKVVTLHQVVLLLDGDLGVLLSSSEVAGQSKAWPNSAGRVFNSLPCLTFDQGVGRLECTLMYLRISTATPADRAQGSQWTLSREEPVNVLTGDGLSYFPYSGSMPNISPPNCSISSSGIAFAAQPRGSLQPGSLSSETYFVPLPSKSQRSFEEPFHLHTVDCGGWSALPVFSNDGKQIAFLREESERAILVERKVLVVRNCLQTPRVESITLEDEAGEPSPLYPQSVQWSPDGTKLYFPACDAGRAKLFSVDLSSSRYVPKQVAPLPDRPGSVLGAIVTGTSGPGYCLLNETSFTSPNRLVRLDLANNDLREVPGQDIPDFGLHPDQVSESFYKSDGRSIHTFVLRPSFFDPAKKYPVALVIHGGPIAAWLDAFHLYWTLPLFAEQGYVLIMPNITGSDGYGRAFRQASYGDFAGKAYRDLEACMDWAGTSLPYIDTTRAISLGGSYGAYMNLWLAGQPLAKRFKALFCHGAGGLGSVNFYSCDIPDVYPRLMTGEGEDYDPADVEKSVGRWDPARFAKNWSTPMMFTHGERDNRCPVSSSIAAFAHCQIMGIDSRLVVFPDESHFILKPENSYHWHREVFDWMDRFAKN